MRIGDNVVRDYRAMHQCGIIYGSRAEFEPGGYSAFFGGIEVDEGDLGLHGCALETE